MGIQQCVRFALLRHTSPTIMLIWWCDVPYNNKKYWRLLIKWAIFLSDYNHVSTFCTNFHKSPVSNLTKIYPMEAELINADGRTNIEANRRFCVNANAPNIVVQKRLCPKPETGTCSSTRRWGDFNKEHFIQKAKICSSNQEIPSLIRNPSCKVHHWILP